MSLKIKALHSGERMILHRVAQFCEKEADAPEFLISLCQTQKQAATAPGLSVKTIKRIKKEALANKGQFSTPEKYGTSN